MNTIWKVGVVALVLAGSPVWAAATHADVTVNGMVCSFCAQGITKKFKARPEVDSVRVVLKDQQVHLIFKDGATMKDDEITALLRQAGYSVEKIDRKAS